MKIDHFSLEIGVHLGKACQVKEGLGEGREIISRWELWGKGWKNTEKLTQKGHSSAFNKTNSPKFLP